MDTNSLDAMLDDTAPTSEPAQLVEQTADEPAAAEATQGDKPDAAPPAAPVEQPRAEKTVPLKAVEDERRKRQELERKVAEYEAMFQQQKQQPPAEPPNWELEPSQAAQAMQAQIQTRLYQQAVYTSERILRQQHPDYDDAATVFAEVARNDPALAAEVFQHPFPAEFAYQHGKRLMLLREIGDDPEAYRQKLREQVMAELQQGTASAPTAKIQAPMAPVPKSLARTASGQQPRDNRGRFAEPDGQAPLEDLIG